MRGYAPRPRRARSRMRGQGGQALVEFAIALPVLMAIILAIVDFGITLNHWETLTDAVRAGGRAAATCRFGGSASSAFSAAATDLPGVAVPGNPACPSTSGGTITYSASYPYHIRVFG